jgi:tape measure domain-containing protein
MTTLAELILKADYRQIDGASTSLDRLTSTGEKSIGMVNRLAGALGVAFGVREIIEASEAYTTINNRLSLVTDSSEELAAAQQDVFNIAQKTRSPLKETAEVYQRLATNADALGMSLAEVGDTTETINKLMVISGTSGASAAAALTQLGQAFASGTLRGEELNSVMEQAPALAKAIADGMGVTVGQLRALGQDGKITADAVVEALKKQGAAVDEQFGKMAPTIGQAMAQAGNSFINYIGKVNEATGASRALASAITGISESLDNGAIEQSTRLFATWGKAFEDASSAMGDWSNEALLAKDIASKFLSEIGNGFVELPSNVVAAVKIASTKIDELIENTANRFERASNRILAVFTDYTWDEAQQRYEKRSAEIEKNSDDAVRSALAARDAEKAYGDMVARRAELEKLLDGTGILDKKPSGKGTSAPDPKELEKQKKDAERRAKWLEDQKIHWQNEITAEMDKIAQQSDIENKAYENHKKKLEEEFATEREAELLRYEQKLADFAEYKKAFGLIDEDAEAKAKRLTIEQEHQDKLTAIEQAAQAKKTANMRQGFGILAGLMTTNSRKLFEIGKAAAIANALINAKESVVSAYAFGSRTGGPILGAVFAAAAAAAQAANISSIASQQFGGGGTVSAAGGSSVSAPDTSNISNQQSAPVRSQIVDIRIQGRGLWRDEDVAELMQAMGERLHDGAKFGRVEFVRS